MKNFNRIALILIIPFLFACEEEGFWNSFDNKIDGQWEFYAAHFEDNRSFGRDDVFNEYRDHVFDIYEDGYFRLYYIDQTGTEVYVDGEWVNWWEDVLNENGNWESVRFIEFRLNDNTLSFFNRMEWQVTHLTNQKLKAREWTGGGRNFYKLRKVE